MLPKKQRVKKALFPMVFSAGRSFLSSNLSVRVLKTPSDSGESKFAFVVPKTVSKKAVNRNLLRRRGYSTVKKVKNRIPPGYTCVFSFKKGSDKLSSAEISKEINFLLEKSGVFKK